MAIETAYQQVNTPRAEQRHTPAVASWSAEPQLGQMVGEYELLECVGRGGLGIVYKARHARTGAVVALKLLRAGKDASDAELHSFSREVMAASRLSHPNILPIDSYGRHEGVPFITMRLLTGGSLDQRFRAGTLPQREGVAILAAIARALHAAHHAKVIHRDLKPGNILLDGDRPLVADFGLARFLDVSGATRPGDVMGSLPYMSPEQADGEGHLADPASDIWPVGVMLYELLAGRRPFAAVSHSALVFKICRQEPPAPSAARAGVPEALERVCMRCLRKQPAARYATAADLADELDRWLATEPGAQVRPVAKPSRTRTMASVAGLLCVLVCGLLVAGAPAANDPGARLRQRLAAAAPGRPASLLDRQGHPVAPPVTLVGRGTTLVAALVGKPLIVEGKSSSLVELVPPDPMRGPFRLTVELQHQDSTNCGRVGFYLGREDHPHADGVVHTSALLGFVEPAVLILRGRAPSRPVPGAKPSALLYLLMVQPTRTHPRRRFTQVGPNVTLTAAPLPENHSPWHVLTMEADGENYRLRNDAGLSVAVPVSAMRKKFADTASGPGMAVIRPTYPTTGGIGLYVDGGTVRVRRALLEPLAAAQNPR